MMINDFLKPFALLTATTALLYGEDFQQESDVSHEATPAYEDDGFQFDDIYLNPNAIHVILEPINRATLSAQITSPVVAVNKQMGDSFKAGEVLIQLDDTIYRANLNKAVATVKQAQLTLNTRQELFEANVGSLAELTEARAEAARADAELAVARKQMEASAIVAPYTGRVVDVYIHDYELAEALEPLMDIIGDEILIARMIIESYQLKQINIGTQLQIAFPEADLIVPAEIIRIGAEIDPASSTVRVDARIENSNLRLTAGMSGVTILPNLPEKEGIEETPIAPMHQLPSPEEPSEEKPDDLNEMGQALESLGIRINSHLFDLEKMRRDLESLGIFEREALSVDIIDFVEEIDDSEICEVDIDTRMKELGLIESGEEE